MKNLIVVRPPESAAFSSAPIPAFAAAASGAEVWLVNDGRVFFGADAVDQIAANAPGAVVRTVDTAFRYGWGGMQKVALRYAVENGFAAVIAAGRWDGSTGPAVQALAAGADGDAAFAAAGDGLAGALINKVAGVRLQGWRADCRLYKTSAVAKVAFELNTSDEHFDTELMLQLAGEGARIDAVAAPGRARGVGGWSRFVNDLKSALKFRGQRYGFFYDVRFHPELLDKKTSARAKTYEPKFDDHSPHSLVRSDDSLVPPGSAVLDIGCSTGYLCRHLASAKKCAVTGVDMLPPSEVNADGFAYHQMNLETEAGRVADLIEKGAFDVVLMLDVLEHLASPELFLLELFKRKYRKQPKFVFSTGNVGFIAVRGMLLLGYFNYGERGILDVTHKRLFSHRTFRTLVEQTGYRIRRQFFFPLPFAKLGMSSAGRLMEWANRFLIQLFPRVFSYQIMFEAEILSLPPFGPAKPGSHEKR